MAVLELAMSSRNKRPRRISDFKCMHPATFSGMAGALKAKQWLSEMENLLRVARIPGADQANVVKIQIIDIART